MALYNDPATKRTRYNQLLGAMKNERATFDPDYRDLADNYAPRRARFLPSDTQGGRRTQQIIDSTGRFAARTLSSGLHSGLTSPARPWFKLTTPDPDLADSATVKEWLHVVTQRMLNLFATTNLYNVLPIAYLDMGIFATAAMSIMRDTKDLFRAYAYPIGSYYLAVDSRGVVSTFAREYRLTVRQIVEAFGVKENGRDIDWANISETVKQQWDAGNYQTPFDLCWMVTPNEDYRANSALPKYAKFSSCTFEVSGGDTTKFLKESGFGTFPIMTPRWDITASEDPYGQDSPGLMALGDVRQLQTMERRKGQLLQKAVDPPLKGPSSLRNQKTSLFSGDITYLDVREGQQGLAPIHEVRLEGFQHLSADQQLVRARINEAWFKDLLLMISGDPSLGADRPTAREIEERHEEKLLALGPVLERTNDELLNPIIDRVFALMLEDNLLPKVPEALAGVNLKVEYVSILAQAQKLIGVVAQDRLLSSVLAGAQVQPDLLDKIDFDRAVDNLGDSLGVDPRVIVPTEVAQQRRQERQQQQRAAAQAEQAVNIAKAAKDASQAPLTGDTVLSQFAQAQASGQPQPQPAGA